jgi:hypothetical protein
VLKALHGSIVPVMDVRDPGDPPQLAGTAIVVSPKAVITSRHVIEGSRNLDPEAGFSFAARSILCGSALRESSRAHASNRWDLCCLHFDQPLDATPAVFARAAHLEGVKLVAVGFQPSWPGLREHTIPDLKVIQVELFEGRLQTAQFGSGIPEGFSGAPILANVESTRLVVGMLFLSGEGKATSRMLAEDPITDFLANEGIDLLMADLPDSPVNPGAATVRFRVGRDVRQSNLEMRGDDIGADVGRDVSGSVIRLNGGKT